MVSISPTTVVKVAANVKPPATAVLNSAFPFTTRLILKPDVAYLAQSAMLSRFFVGLARVWLNRPANIKDPRLSPAQKKQAFLERVFMEGFGTPSYMLVMQLASDLSGLALQAAGFIKPALSQLQTVSKESLAHANVHLQTIVGTKNILSNLVFDNQRATYTNYINTLKTNGLEHLTRNPEFLRAAEQWFRTARVGASLTLVASMFANFTYGGIIMQKMNDEWFAPMLQRLLYVKPTGHKHKASDE